MISAAGRAVRLPFVLCLYCCLAFVGFAQEVKPLSAKIASLEKTLARGPGPGEKNRAFRELARLQELSGNMESAARSWNEAVLALPERDYDALLHRASCLAASGEFDSAVDVARQALLSADSGVRTRTLYLTGQIEAFRTGNTAPLRSLLSEQAFVPFGPAICYTIWKVSGEAAWRSKLLAEFPQSPEALALRDGVVSPLPSALWLLGSALPLSGMGPVVSAEGGNHGEPPTPVSGETGPVMLQTGLFGQEENARVLAARLSRAGFQSMVTKKQVNGTIFWAVGVAPGQDHNRTILLLKDSGFEAFPVY